MCFQVESPHPYDRLFRYQGQALGRADANPKRAEPARSQRHGDTVQFTCGKTATVQDVYH